MRRCSVVLSLLLLGAGPPRLQPPVSIVFEAPAGVRPAGTYDPAKPFSQILPSGRIVSPVGDSVVVGRNSLGVALSPDGRYAIVSNDDARQDDAVNALDPQTRGGYSLAVVDTRTMQVVDRYRDDDETFFTGVVALKDPAYPSKTLVLAAGGPSNEVYALNLDANGHLLPAERHRIAIPAPLDEGFANFGRAFPGTIVASRDGLRAYVVNELAASVSTIDTKTRALLGVSPNVGFFPYGASIAGDRILVTNEGLMRYARLPSAPALPPSVGIKPDLQHASSLSLLPIAWDGSLRASVTSLPMDPVPDGLARVGGAHPSAIVTSPDKTYAYVAMTNVDRIASVLLGPSPHVVGGTELRLYARSPYGTQPNALALSKDGRRLYVALAGINAVAVLDASDPRRLHRIGLLPTGWYPTALALSNDDRFLFVVNTKGFSHKQVWSTLQRIDLRYVNLRKATRMALAYQHATHVLLPNGIVPQAFASKGSSVIKHVVLIEQEHQTYDAMLGDLTDATGRAYGFGDPALTTYNRVLTPNLHQLAATFGLAGNFYADTEDADSSEQFALGGIASVYTEKTLPLRNEQEQTNGDNPEDYPRSGYIFNSLAQAKKSYRYYGDAWGEKNADVPLLAALEGHVDSSYPQAQAGVRDTLRATEFVRDFDTLVKSGNMPAFTAVRLAGEDVPDGDRALGAIVDYLTHLPEWRQTAIFVMSSDAQSAHDHINAHRTYAIVISPYAKRHYVSSRHLSSVSVLKTEEELLGLPPLSLGDVLTSDMRDFFTSRLSVTPFIRDANGMAHL